jgi:hypothetical protein
MTRLRAMLVLAQLAAPAALGAQAAPQAPRDSAAAAPPTLVREVFSYEGGGRDPFVSLLKSGEVRPLISDLKLVSVLHDARYPARSVAVLRDVTTGKRYRVRARDVLGRLRVTSIRPREVVFTVQEFGFERQETLALRRQEETP